MHCIFFYSGYLVVTVLSLNILWMIAPCSTGMPMAARRPRSLRVNPRCRRSLARSWREAAPPADHYAGEHGDQSRLILDLILDFLSLLVVVYLGLVGLVGVVVHVAADLRVEDQGRLVNAAHEEVRLSKPCTRVIFIFTLFTNHLWACSQIVPLLVLFPKQFYFFGFDHF